MTTCLQIMRSMTEPLVTAAFLSALVLAPTISTATTAATPTASTTTPTTTPTLVQATPAPEPCGDYPPMAQLLRKKYGETIVLVLFKAPDSVFEVFLDVDDESWSLVQRYSDDSACLRSDGIGFLDIGSILAPELDGDL